MKKPIFFISSTIYDFADLRSSIKFFLEEQGCKVLASEYSDFDLSYNQHSYDECLENLKKADYFILLIGYRIGGAYSKDPFISITHKEYREAYKLHKQGNLKIVNFVRKEIYNIKNQRYYLGKSLDSLEMSIEDKEKIKYYESNGFKNPKYIFDFIDEVSKNEDTKKATNCKSKFPTNNWIHFFSNFEEIINVLSPLVFNSLPIADAINIRILKESIRYTIKNIIFKFGEIVYNPKLIISEFEEIYNESITPKERKQDLLFDYIDIDVKKIMKLYMPIIDIPNKKNILVSDLSRIIQSETFLIVDKETGILKSSPIYKLLIDLRTTIETFNSLNTDNFTNILASFVNNSDAYVRIRTSDFISIYSLFKYWFNIIEYLKVINSFIDTGEYKEPNLINYAVFKSQESDIKKQIIQDEDIDSILMCK